MKNTFNLLTFQPDSLVSLKQLFMNLPHKCLPSFAYQIYGQEKSFSHFGNILEMEFWRLQFNLAKLTHPKAIVELIFKPV